ncbi:hypothetical protein PEBR_29637 [Penicillium brasilianum]|uniref:Uncharacterized protein n=1 Tax=Penicillium brasilianum TaxID=104259 RepID=A0A1S9RH33_PENBI|nr:hypothetical protein PEBR_29637 [Penicillium brasilianum]
MTRPIYLAAFKNYGYPAHWAIFVPNTQAGNVGKLIHVIGSSTNGFFLEFKRNYDFSTTRSEYQMIHLADVEERFVARPVANAPKETDTTPRDRLEMAAKIVDPPPRSLIRFDPPKENCQGWIQRYLQQLVNDGLLNDSALLVIQNAPKTL